MGLRTFCRTDLRTFCAQVCAKKSSGQAGKKFSGPVWLRSSDHGPEVRRSRFPGFKPSTPSSKKGSHTTLRGPVAQHESLLAHIRSLAWSHICMMYCWFHMRSICFFIESLGNPWGSHKRCLTLDFVRTYSSSREIQRYARISEILQEKIFRFLQSSTQTTSRYHLWQPSE